MSIVKAFKKNKLLLVVIITYIALLVVIPQKAIESGRNSMYYVIEMIQIMPVIFILTSLIEAWIPRETIIKGFGENSGFKGAILSFILGSFSAGPIYAAFPVCKTLFKKGASISNIVIILSTWAVIKIPMLANEAKFLGPKFMMVRWILTAASIFIIAYSMSVLIKKDSIPIDNEEIKEVRDTLDIKHQYCIGCGICTQLLPDNFVLVDGKAKVKRNQVSLKGKENINEIIKKCPAKAISFK